MTAPKTEAERAEHATKVGSEQHIVTVGRLHVLGPAADWMPEPSLNRLKDQFSNAIPYFTHIWSQPVTIGVIEDYHEAWDDAVACVAPRNQIVFVQPDQQLSNRTVFHELAHLEIYARDEAGHDVPTSSEEFCDIYAMARMPPDMIDTDRFAYLGEPSMPASEWPRICRRALEYREDHRNYIQRCKEWLGI